MKRVLMLCLLVLSVLAFSGCQDVKVGEIGVKVFLYGGAKGETQILPTGRYTMGWGEELYTYPTTQVQYSFTQSSIEGSEVDEGFRFTANGGTLCIADVGVIAYADPKKADILYKTYRKDMESIIKTFVRQDIRDELNREMPKLTVEDMYNGKAVVAMKTVEQNIRAKLEPVGITIMSISFLKNIDFPKAINDSIEAKIKSTQDTLKIQNQLFEAEAQAKIKIVNAEAEAKTNQLKMQAVTAELIRYEEVKNQAAAIVKWNGVLPTTVTGENGKFLMGIK